MASKAHGKFRIGDVVVLGESVSVRASKRSIAAGEGGVIVNVDPGAPEKLNLRLVRQFRWLRGNIVPADAQQVALVARAWRWNVSRLLTVRCRLINGFK
jgi:hypothetical protein